MATGSGESALSAEGVFSPTNFLLEEVLIQRQNLGGADAGQDSIDVKAIVPEIKIRESIYNNAINVDIRLIDSQKLLEFLRINGTEKIKLKIARSALATEKVGLGNVPFVILSKPFTSTVASFPDSL